MNGARRFQCFTIRWGNPYTQPPADVPTIDGRTLYAVTMLDPSMRDLPPDAPDIALGSGWAHCIHFDDRRPVQRWSPERKAAARRANLQRRIEHRFPLFADMFVAGELARRPDYFDPAAIARADAEHRP